MSPRKQSGFTLIELLIVVTLIGILSTLIVPSVSHYRHKAAVAAAQGTAHCLETGLTGFDSQSSDPVDRYPMGISDQSSLITAANQIGCKMSPTAARLPIGWANCEMIIVCPDGSVVTQTCNTDPNVACGSGQPVRVDYGMTFSVPGYGDTIKISSFNAMETFRSPVP
ncbi:MAG: type II secretion system protein [Thermoanaerobaculia bacterium]